MSQPEISKPNSRYGLVRAMDITVIGILITLAIVLPHPSVFLWLIALVWAVVAIRRGVNERRARRVGDRTWGDPSQQDRGVQRTRRWLKSSPKPTTSTSVRAPGWPTVPTVDQAPR